MARTKIVAGVFVLAILLGGAGLYFYTSPPGVASPPRIPATRTTSNGGNSSAYQDSNGKPYGSWATFLGFIPSGYVPAAHQSNAPNFPCPPDMSASACATFKQTCGNDICDPNESCSTCPIDCAPSGNLVCDPYTGRPGQPSSVCQAVVGGNNYG